MKERLKKMWLRFKHWVVSILVAIGLVSVAWVQPLDLNYTAPTTYEDGSPLPIEEIAETRLYCNGTLTMTESGADGAFSNVDSFLAPGTYTCYGTVVATNGLESRPSNEVTRTILSSSAPEPMELAP